jgi:hypothetical protein
VTDSIDALVAMSDAELSKKFGFDQQLADAKKALAELATLTGDAREHAVKRVDKMLQPNIYPSEFGWIKEDAERHACRSAKDEMCDCSPASIGPR